ncbi:hypothetical protein NP493_436g01043, partial [Ridgeia piscesae]
CLDSWVELHFQQNRGLPADSPGVFKPISVSNTQMEKLLLEAQRESSSRTSSRGGTQEVHTAPPQRWPQHYLPTRWGLGRYPHFRRRDALTFVTVVSKDMI